MELVEGRTYDIDYISASGEATRRRIQVIETFLESDDRSYLRAWCFLRGSERTFRVDRVREARETNSSLIDGIATASPGPFPWQGASSPTIRGSVTPASASWAARAPAAVATRAFAVEPSTRKAQVRHHWDFWGEIVPGCIQIVGKVWYAGALVLFCLIVLQKLVESLPPSPPPYWQARPAAWTPSPPAVPAPARTKPVPPPPSMETITIGGMTLVSSTIGGVTRYSVPDLGFESPEKRFAIAAIRTPAFIERTRLDDEKLIGRYLSADTNRSGKLSWDELQAFQTATFREFAYKSNEVALSPLEFLEHGGGDCEDFALYSAGLLRYWGWDPWLGSLGPKSGTGHAVCLSFEEGGPPASFTYFTLTSWRTESGDTLADGTYVPIDYDEVGKLSNAVGKGWKLRAVWRPEEAWGRVM